MEVLGGFMMIFLTKGLRILIATLVSSNSSYSLLLDRKNEF
jgi:hypothetical protein